MNGNRNDGLAIASMVLGICTIIPFVGLICAVLATVFGAVSLRHIRRDPSVGGRGMAIAGLTLGIIGLAVAVLVVVLVAAAGSNGSGG